MKMFSGWASVALVVFLALTSCTNPVQSSVTGDLELTTDFSNGRTILPEVSLEVQSYQIILLDDSAVDFGGTFAKNESKTISELPLGSYTLTVNALNSLGQTVASASKSIQITSGLNSESLTLVAGTSGTGALLINGSFPSASGVTKIVARYKPYGETFLPEEELAFSNGAFSYSKTISSGEYQLEIELFDGETLLNGIYEIFWIVDNITSTKSYSIQIEGYEIPEAPTNFRGNYDSGVNYLSWDDNSDNESGFAIERGVVGGNYSPLVTTSANSESYQDATVVLDTTYEYRIKALGLDGDSPWVGFTQTIEEQNGEGDLNITLTLTDPEDLENIIGGLVDPLDQAVTVNAQATGASGYDWRVDGISVSTNSSFTLDPEDYNPGLHTLTLIVMVDGEYYSNSLNFTVDEGEVVVLESLSVNGEIISAVNDLYHVSLLAATSEALVLATANSPAIDVDIAGLTSPATITTLPTPGTSEDFTITLTGVSKTKVYTLRITREEAVFDGKKLFVQAASAPTIWAWEPDGNNISAERGRTWNTQETMGSTILNDWWVYEIASSEMATGNITFLINQGAQEYAAPAGDESYLYSTGSFGDDPFNVEDITAPEIQYTPTNTSTAAASLDLTILATDNMDPSPDIFYTLDGSPANAGSTPYSSTLTITENVTVNVFAIDESGNSSTVSIPVEVSAVIPTSVSASRSSGDFTEESFSVILSVSGSAVTSSTYQVDGGPSTTFSNGTSITLGGSDLAVGESITLVISASGPSGIDTKTYVYTKAEAPAGYFATNPNGQKGQFATITIDGTFDDWSNDMIIATDVANDDARIFLGSHEGPVYDLYALYAAWDTANLYLMWQYTNVTDVTDPAQGFPISDNGKPWNGDIPISIAFDIDPSISADGMIDGTEDTVWGVGTFNTFANGVDRLAMFSSKPGVGQPAIFKTNANDSFDYEEENVLMFTEYGVEFLYGDGFKPNTMMGVSSNGWAGYDPSDLSDLTQYVDFLETGHSTAQDTMYEMVIPFDILGIDQSYLETNGIGVMLISTFGQSGVDSVPHDMATLDNAKEPYSADASTSAEKEDHDNFTSPLARVGN